MDANLDAFGLPPIGHNRPDPLDLDALRDRLTADGRDLDDRCRELVASSESAYCTDATSAEKCTLLMGQIAGAAKDCEKRRTEAKRPYDDAAKTIQGHFKPVLDALDAAKAKLSQMLGAYQAAQRQKAEAERRRLEAEAEAQRQAAAAAAAKGDDLAAARIEARAEAKAEQAAAVDTRAITRSVGGVSSSLNSRWDFNVTDPARVPREYCSVDPAKIRAAIKEGARQIPGVNIFESHRAVARSA